MGTDGEKNEKQLTGHSFKLVIVIPVLSPHLSKKMYGGAVTPAF